jgi:hypothetical protein
MKANISGWCRWPISIICNSNVSNEMRTLHLLHSRRFGFKEDIKQFILGSVIRVQLFSLGLVLYTLVASNFVSLL